MKKEYGPQGIHFLHVLTGEGTLTAEDYQMHYRSVYPHLIDPIRAFEKNHNNNGWPFYLIVNLEGHAIYKKSTAISKDRDEITTILDQITQNHRAYVTAHDGIEYAEPTVKANKSLRSFSENYPCLISDSRGRLYFSYSTNRKGELLSGIAFFKDGEITHEHLFRDQLFSYHAVITMDPNGRLWYFCTALAESGNFDIFARYMKTDLSFSDAVNLTHSDNDAMHPAATVDAAGKVWVTYYRWHKMGAASRDKEVYARCFDGEKWCDEIRLSPEDVPTYEDHTDPSIAPNDGEGVSVAWSWDMHPLKEEKYKKYQDEYHVEHPSIFGRKVTQAGGAGDLLFLGHGLIDAAPSLYRDSEGRLWCAWNTLGVTESGEFRKSLRVSLCEKGESTRSREFVVEGEVQDICSPSFAEREGQLYLVWSSQDMAGDWVLKYSRFRGESWRKPMNVYKKPERHSSMEPRFPSITTDPEGRIWIAFSAMQAINRNILLKEIELK